MSYKDQKERNFFFGMCNRHFHILCLVFVFRMIRLADYISNKVITRAIPQLLNTEILKEKPNVVMKLDIEGSELEVLPDLLVTGSLQHIDLVTIEYHPDCLLYTSDAADE